MRETYNNIRVRVLHPQIPALAVHGKDPQRLTRGQQTLPGPVHDNSVGSPIGTEATYPSEITAGADGFVWTGALSRNFV